MAENDTRVDSAVVMLAVAVVCSVAPRSVVVGSPDLYRRTAALFRRHLHTEHAQVTQKCLQSLSSLFARKEIGGAFVRVLGSDVFGIVRPLVTAKRTDDLTEEQLAVYQEALKAVEAVLTIAETKKRLALLNVLVQSLCALLAREPATEWRDWSPPRRRLHEFALARLNAIGPAHPEQFKHVLLAHPQVKHQLEASLLWQSNRAAMATANQKNKTAMDAAKLAAAAAAAKPAIQLKMDFATNFSQS